MHLAESISRTRWRMLLATLVAIPLLVAAGLGLYFANLAGALPWQSDQAPIPATPSADLHAGQAGQAATPSTAGPRTPAPRPRTTHAILGAGSAANDAANEQLFNLASPSDAGGMTKPMTFDIVATDQGDTVSGGAPASFTAPDIGITSGRVGPVGVVDGTVRLQLTAPAIVRC